MLRTSNFSSWRFSLVWVIVQGLALLCQMRTTSNNMCHFVMCWNTLHLLLSLRIMTLTCACLHHLLLWMDVLIILNHLNMPVHSYTHHQGDVLSPYWALKHLWISTLAIPAQHKGQCCEGQGKDMALQRTQRGHTFGKRRQVQPECNNGIRDRGAVWQLHFSKNTATGNGIRGRSRKWATSGKKEGIIWDPWMNEWMTV
jgi:hypothetical protein